MKIDMTTSQQLKLKCYELAIQHRRDRPDLVMLCAKSLYGWVRAENNAPVDHPLTIDLQKLENAMQNVFENPLAGLKIRICKPVWQRGGSAGTAKAGAAHR